MEFQNSILFLSGRTDERTSPKQYALSTFSNIYHECECEYGIEKITIGHHEACRIYKKS